MQLVDFDALRARVQTPSAEISYAEAGNGSPVLFVHGVGTSAALWRNVFEQVDADRRLLALDLPLHGHSSVCPGQDFALGALADVVAEFCDALQLSQVDLVAHDTGGAIAQIFAARHPDRIRTLTLTNCDTHDNVPPDAFKPTVDLARAGELAPTAPALLADLSAARAVVFATGYEDPEWLTLDIVRAFLEPVIGTAARAEQFQQLLCALEPRDLLAAEPALRELTAPTLVVWATGDEFFDVRWAYWLRDTIPGVVDVVEIEGAKLFFPDERASDLVPHLQALWSAADRDARVAS
jgi:pimeloyl-ACP methyl ester carboxylesterase